jgi:NADPH-dependent curcumin reductase CurA
MCNEKRTIKQIFQVGGEISSIIMYHMKSNGRVAVVGSISTYNADAKTLPKGMFDRAFYYLFSHKSTRRIKGSHRNIFILG